MLFSVIFATFIASCMAVPAVTPPSYEYLSDLAERYNKDNLTIDEKAHFATLGTRDSGDGVSRLAARDMCGAKSCAGTCCCTSCNAFPSMCIVVGCGETSRCGPLYAPGGC